MMDLLKDAAGGNMDLYFMRPYTLYVANEVDEKKKLYKHILVKRYHFSENLVIPY